MSDFDDLSLHDMSLIVNELLEYRFGRIEMAVVGGAFTPVETPRAAGTYAVRQG
jgi:hypothetical protein